MTIIESRPITATLTDDATAEAVVRLSDVRKSYGTFDAVRGVSLDIRQGEIFGLLGPNGAGKTTTLEMTVGLRTPTSGTIRVLEHDPHTDRVALAHRIGVQPQDAALFATLRVRETLDLFASFYPRPVAVDTVLDMVDLAGKAKSLVKSLSGGQRQRLLIGLAFIGDPKIVFLDEPSGSLDPQARRQLWSAIERFRDMGRTIVLTTHAMEEATALCNRVAIMDQGKIIALGTPAALVRQYVPVTTIRFETTRTVEPTMFSTLLGVREVHLTAIDAGTQVEIVTEDSDRVLQSLLCTPAGAAWRNVAIASGTLEDVFLALTGRTIRD